MQAVVAVLREHAGGDRTSPRRARCGGARRRSATSTSSRRATDPAELTALLRGAARGSSTSSRTATRRRRSSRTTGCASTCASCRRSRSATCSSTSPARRITTSRMREDAVRRGLSISEYGVTNVETGEVFKTPRTRTRSTSSSATSRSRRSCARTRGELEAARARRAAGARRAARRPRRPAHALPLVGRRQEHARGDGRGRASRAATSTTRSPTIRTTSATAGSHAQLEEIEAMRARFPKLTILAGVEANIRSNGEVDVPDEELALLDWVVASVHNAPDNRVRPSACSRRCRTRTSTASATSPGGGSASAPPRDVDVERVIEGALETGTLPRDQRPAGPARPARRARARREGGGAEARRQLRRAPDPRAGLRRARRSAQARRGWLTKADVANTRTWKQLDKLRRKRP